MLREAAENKARAIDEQTRQAQASETRQKIERELEAIYDELGLEWDPEAVEWSADGMVATVDGLSFVSNRYYGLRLVQTYEGEVYEAGVHSAYDLGRLLIEPERLARQGIPRRQAEPEPREQMLQLLAQELGPYLA